MALLMSDVELTELAEFELPFGRRAILRQAKFESGLTMVRLVLREGTRITQIDLDDNSAAQLGKALTNAATDISANKQS